jgi:hypothetical protein
VSVAGEGVADDLAQLGVVVHDEQAGHAGT